MSTKRRERALRANVAAAREKVQDGHKYKEWALSLCDAADAQIEEASKELEEAEDLYFMECKKICVIVNSDEEGGGDE
jgi:hypothetical protein